MKISIITACYNSAPSIQTTIESVLSQTYSDIEYIIIDGKSNDGTVDIIKNYESAFAKNKLKWLSESDQGMYDAINKGIRMATGEVVGILNSDDFYNYPHCIETVAKAFEDSNIDACFADVRFVKPDNLDKTIRYYSSAQFHPRRFRWGFMPAHPTFFVRKKYFDEISYYKTDYQIAADYELLIRFLYTHQLKYKYIPLDMIKMRTGGKSTQSWESNYILNKEIVRGCKENGIYTNMLMLSFKYFQKFVELINTRN
jgi:glycosyltransferase involved in cell wall biosynthesis